MENKQWLDEVKTAIEEISPRLGLTQVNRFTWNPLYQVAASKESKSTIEQVFGKSLLGRWKLHGRKIFKFKKPVSEFESYLPADSIIFFKPGRERLIAGSKDLNLLLKFVVKKDQFELFDEEAKLLKQLEKSPFGENVVKLVDDGVTRNGVRWIATTLGDNSDPLVNHSDLERFLVERADKLILGPMGKFYLQNDWKKFSLEEWLELARARSVKHPQKEVLFKALDSIKKRHKPGNHFQLVQGQLHFDLHAGNIIFDGQNPTFIDWEVTHQGLVLIDVFDSYRRLCNKRRSEMKKLLCFLNNKGPAPQALRSLYQRYRGWLQENFNAEVGMCSEDLVMILYAVERTLIYQEKWQADRIAANGFESKVIQALT